MGITAARTAVISNDDVEAIVVQRYDRAPTPEGGLARVHQEDLCQALGCSPDTKYQFQGGPTPASIATRCARWTPRAAHRWWSSSGTCWRSSG